MNQEFAEYLTKGSVPLSEL